MNCIICRENIDKNDQIQLDCKCKNSFYHVKCIEDWINKNPSKRNCINCFTEISNNNLNFLLEISSSVKNIKLGNYVIKNNYLIIYFILNLIIGSVILFYPNEDIIYGKTINEINSGIFIISKIHV